MDSAIAHLSSMFRLLIIIIFCTYGSLPDAGNRLCLQLGVGAFQLVI